MTTYYVDGTDGSSGNAGTSAGAAKATIAQGLALVSTSGGDTLIIAPGIYREVFSFSSFSSATTETVIRGDIYGKESWTTHRTGKIIISQWTSGPTSSPPASDVLSMDGGHFITFESLVVLCAFSSRYALDMYGSASHDITVRGCTLAHVGDGASAPMRVRGYAGNTVNLLVENSVLITKGGTALGCQIFVDLHTSDYDANVVFRNNLILGSVIFTSSGSGSGNVYGFLFENLTIRGYLSCNAAALRSSTPAVYVYGCIIESGSSVAIYANTSGQVVEDYNVLISTTTTINITGGANSVARYEANYVLPGDYGLHCGQLQEPWTPALGNQFEHFDGHASPPTTDAFGFPRPSATVKGVAGWAYGKSAVKETTTTDSGNAIKLVGHSYHEFLVPVDASSTTISVKVQFDATYDEVTNGNYPLLRLLEGGAGITPATDVATSSADGSFETLSLTFTPTHPGYVRVRFESRSGNATGATFWDTWTVS